MGPAIRVVKPLRGGILSMGPAGRGGRALPEAGACREGAARETAAVGGPLLARLLLPRPMGIPAGCMRAGVLAEGVCARGAGGVGTR